jgi:hypothetical protein
MKLVYSIIDNKEVFSQLTYSGDYNTTEFDFTLSKLSNYFAHKLKNSKCLLFHNIDSYVDKTSDFLFDESIFVNSIDSKFAKLVSNKTIIDLHIQDAICFLYALSQQKEKFLYLEPGALLLDEEKLFSLNTNGNILPFKFGVPKNYINKIINMVGINPPEISKDKDLDSYDLSFIVSNHYQSTQKTAEYLLNFIDTNLNALSDLILMNNHDLLPQGNSKYLIDFNFIIKNVWFPSVLKSLNHELGTLIPDDEFLETCDDFLVDILSSNEEIFHINVNFNDSLNAVKRRLLTQNSFSKGIVSQRFFDNAEENVISSLCKSIF